jgi:hypothetical protein
MRNNLMRLAFLAMALTLVLAACGPAAPKRLWLLKLHDRSPRGN